MAEFQPSEVQRDAEGKGAAAALATRSCTPGDWPCSAYWDHVGRGQDSGPTLHSSGATDCKEMCQTQKSWGLGGEEFKTHKGFE